MDSPIWIVHIVYIHGLFYCWGKINHAISSVAIMNPILLPTEHLWINLLISHVHQQVKHSGMTDSLSTTV